MKCQHFKTIFVSIIMLLIFFKQAIALKSIQLLKKAEVGSDEAPYIFFRITDIAIGSNGDIFVLDSGAAQIKKFTKEFIFLKEIGKSGQGPGEMNTPLGIAIDKLDNIYLNDSGNRRINVYDKDLKFIDSIHLEGKRSFNHVFIDKDDNLLMFYTPRNISEYYFYRFTPKGYLINAFGQIFHPFAPKIIDFQTTKEQLYLFIYFLSRASLSQGKDFIAFSHINPENPYKIYIMDSQGKIIKVIQRKIDKYDPKQFKEKYLKRDLPSLPVHISISKLSFTREGLLFVQRQHDYYRQGKFLKSEYFFDIFSLDGKLLRKDIKLERLLAIDRENNIYTVSEDDKGIIKIKVYSLIIK